MDRVITFIGRPLLDDDRYRRILLRIDAGSSRVIIL